MSPTFTYRFHEEAELLVSAAHQQGLGLAPGESRDVGLGLLILGLSQTKGHAHGTQALLYSIGNTTAARCCNLLELKEQFAKVLHFNFL